uniref:Phosphotransferase n=1 Tax=Romanomermis culicivorax TaxID=13658 RepID=A0A915KB79_ROMCU
MAIYPLRLSLSRFDKLVAGMCMGEIMRLVLAKLARNKLLFNNCQYGLLFTSEAFHTKYISEILSDQAGRLHNTRQVLEEMGVDGFQYSDLITIREISSCISRRSANLAATAIAAVVLRLQKKNVTVGIDGSTFRYHPFYHFWLKDKIRELLPPDIEVNIVQAGDGSGKGAALVAAIAETL